MFNVMSVRISNSLFMFTQINICLNSWYGRCENNRIVQRNTFTFTAFIVNCYLLWDHLHEMQFWVWWEYFELCVAMLRWRLWTGEERVQRGPSCQLSSIPSPSSISPPIIPVLRGPVSKIASIQSVIITNYQILRPHFMATFSNSDWNLLVNMEL